MVAHHVEERHAAQDAAEQVRALHEDRALWHSVRDAALAAVRRDFSPEAFAAGVSQVVAALWRPEGAGNPR